MLHLDRGVADHLEQLLMGPNVIFARSNIEISHKDRLFRGLITEPVAHLGKVIQFMAEFLVHLTVGHIAARGDIAVMDGDAILEPRCHMAGIALAHEITVTHIFQRVLGQDRNAVVTLLPARNHIAIAKLGEHLEGDLVDGAFAFLQAQHIRRFLLQQLGHGLRTKADRVDVPSGKSERHGAAPFHLLRQALIPHVTAHNASG